MQIIPKRWKDRSTVEVAHLANKLLSGHAGFSIRNTDTGIFYTWNGVSMERNPSVVNGAPLVSKYYYDANYTYKCEADSGTYLTDPKWRVTRTNDVTQTVDYAGTNFDMLATNLAIVVALQYNNGVEL